MPIKAFVSLIKNPAEDINPREKDILIKGFELKQTTLGKDLRNKCSSKSFIILCQYNKASSINPVNPDYW